MKIFCYSLPILLVCFSALAQGALSNEEALEPFLGVYSLVDQTTPADQENGLACLDKLEVKKTFFGLQEDKLQVIVKNFMKDESQNWSTSFIYLNSGIVRLVDDCPTAGPVVPFCEVVSTFEQTIEGTDLFAEKAIEQKLLNGFVSSNLKMQKVFMRSLPGGRIFFASLDIQESKANALSPTVKKTVHRTNCVYAPDNQL